LYHQDYFSEAKAIVRVQAQWNGASATWDMDILKGSDENYMHMVYVSPSAAFDQLLNPACDDQFILRRKPEKIDFLYVFERLPEKAINVSQSLECVGEKFDEWGSMRARGVFAPNSYQVFDIVDGYIIPPQHRNPQLDLVSDDIGSDALKLENIITALTP